MKKKSLRGRVISNKMDKTLVVEVTERGAHPRYKKIVKRRSKYYVHDPRNSYQVGEFVEFFSTRPLSKLKQYCVCSRGGDDSRGE